MRRTLTMVMLLACGSGTGAGPGVGQIQHRARGQQRDDGGSPRADGERPGGWDFRRAVHRIGDDDEQGVSRWPIPTPTLAVPLRRAARHECAGSQPATTIRRLAAVAEAATSTRPAAAARTRGAALWGYGDDCHVGAARVEYLMWFSRGRSAPPLVTTSPAGTTAVPMPACCPTPRCCMATTRRSARTCAAACGSRSAGCWPTNAPGSKAGSGASRTAPSGSSPMHRLPDPGPPVFQRPCCGVEDALLVTYPGITADGGVNVLSKNDMFVGRRLDSAAPGPTTAARESTSWPAINSPASTTSSASPTCSGRSIRRAAFPSARSPRFPTSSRRRTSSTGLQVGMLFERRKGCWSVEALGKIGLGNMRQRVAVRGHTITTEPAPFPLGTEGGMLALPSNIGEYQRNQFAFIPELNVNLCYNLSPCWKLMVGYYVHLLQRRGAGRQSDRSRGQLLADSRPHRSATIGRGSAFNNSDFLIQGVNVGAEYRW